MSDQTKYSNKLHNARILVIGASSGIGYGVAEACLESNALVTIASSNQSRIDAALSSLKNSYPSKTSNVHGLTVDLSNPDTLEQELAHLFAETVKQLPGGKLDHVIFTAGDPLSTMKIADISMSKILQAGQIRFFAPLLIAKFIPRYVEASSRSSYVITTGSVAERPMPEWSVIGAFAGGLHSMVRNLALDLKPVRVNGVSPGAVDTALWTMPEEEKSKFFEVLGAKLLTGKVGKVEDVAESYLGLLKDGNVDGAMVRTDGGASAI